MDDRWHVSILSLHTLLPAAQQIGSRRPYADMRSAMGALEGPGVSRRSPCLRIPRSHMRFVSSPRTGYVEEPTNDWLRQYASIFVPSSGDSDGESVAQPGVTTYRIADDFLPSLDFLEACLVHTQGCGWHLAVAARVDRPSLSDVITLEKILFDPELEMLVLTEGDRACSLVEAVENVLDAYTEGPSETDQAVSSGGVLDRLESMSDEACVRPHREGLEAPSLGIPVATRSPSPLAQPYLESYFPLQLVWIETESLRELLTGDGSLEWHSRPDLVTSTLVDSLLRKELPIDFCMDQVRPIRLNLSSKFTADVYMSGNEVVLISDDFVGHGGEVAAFRGILNASFRTLAARDQARWYASQIARSVEVLPQEVRLTSDASVPLGDDSSAHLERLRERVADLLEQVSLVGLDVETRLAIVEKGNAQELRFGRPLKEFADELSCSCGLPTAMESCKRSLLAMELFLTRTKSVLDFRAQSTLMKDSSGQLAKLAEILRGNEIVRLVVIVFAMVATSISIGQLWIAVNSMPRANPEDYVAPSLYRGAALSVAILGLGALLGTIAWMVSGSRRGRELPAATRSSVKRSIWAECGMVLLATLAFVPADDVEGSGQDLVESVLSWTSGSAWVLILGSVGLGLAALYLIAKAVRSLNDPSST